MRCIRQEAGAGTGRGGCEGGKTPATRKCFCGGGGKGGKDQSMLGGVGDERRNLVKSNTKGQTSWGIVCWSSPALFAIIEAGEEGHAEGKMGGEHLGDFLVRCPGKGSAPGGALYVLGHRRKKKKGRGKGNRIKTKGR